MKLWFRINGLEFCSWFIVWKYLMRAFQQVGVQVYESPFNAPKDISEYVELHWADPQFWAWSNKNVKLRAGIALSEHRSLLRPDKAMGNLQKAQVLICPCESAAQAFYEAPLDMPIRIAPFGVDDDDLAYHERDWDGKFRFLLIGVSQFRKGSWLAVEAFRGAFQDRDDVSLSVASYSGSESPMFSRLKSEYDKYNNIDFYGKADNAKEYYHSHHVIVSPHLSEGWGLTIPEAMATGMPGIIARCSAPREYFSPDFGWWIEMSDDYAPVDQCLTGVKGSWRLPSVDSLVAQMQHAVDNRKECQTKGRAASDYVLKNLTWKQSALKIIKILEEYL